MIKGRAADTLQCIQCSMGSNDFDLGLDNVIMTSNRIETCSNQLTIMQKYAIATNNIKIDPLVSTL